MVANRRGGDNSNYHEWPPLIWVGPAVLSNEGRPILLPSKLRGLIARLDPGGSSSSSSDERLAVTVVLLVTLVGGLFLGDGSIDGKGGRDGIDPVVGLDRTAGGSPVAEAGFVACGCSDFEAPKDERRPDPDLCSASTPADTGVMGR